MYIYISLILIYTVVYAIMSNISYAISSCDVNPQHFVPVGAALHAFKLGALPLATGRELDGRDGSREFGAL